MPDPGLAEEIERLCTEYRTGAGSEKQEAWNLIADCVEANEAQIVAALRSGPERVEAMREELHRLSLVIESAVRNADPGNHAAVVALLRSAAPLSPEGEL